MEIPGTKRFIPAGFELGTPLILPILVYNENNSSHDQIARVEHHG